MKPKFQRKYNIFKSVTRCILHFVADFFVLWRTAYMQNSVAIFLIFVQNFGKINLLTAAAYGIIIFLC